MMKRLIPALMLSLGLAASVSPARAADEKDIVVVATDAKVFKTLLKAATEAGLVDTLKSKGPFTVFAPTDEAFAKLPAGTVEGLLKDKEKLKTILLNHIVKGEVTAKDATGLVGKEADAVGGGKLKIAKDGESLTVGGSKVVKADIKASNGVIHVIDAVIVLK